MGNKNKSMFNTKKSRLVVRMGDINSLLDQLDEKVNNRYAELKANIEKNNNDLIGLKVGLEQGIDTLHAEQKKT